MRRPISRVRSVTDTNMMFMMPTPPTTREIMATTRSSLVIMPAVEVSALVISVMSRMLKSSGSPGLARWRSRSNWVIWLMAAGISPVDPAAAMIWSTLVKRTGSGVSAAWTWDCSG